MVGSLPHRPLPAPANVVGIPGTADFQDLLVFDDYGMITCPGAKRALDEFCAAHNETPLYLPTGQALLFRRP